VIRTLQTTPEEPRTFFSVVFAKIAYDYATDFIKAEPQVGLTFSILALQSMYADKTWRQYSPCWNNPPSSRPSKICCLRFHSAALFKD
jgi:hypothetical protein